MVGESGLVECNPGSGGFSLFNHGNLWLWLIGIINNRSPNICHPHLSFCLTTRLLLFTLCLCFSWVSGETDKTTFLTRLRSLFVVIRHDVVPNCDANTKINMNCTQTTRNFTFVRWFEGDETESDSKNPANMRAMKHVRVIYSDPMRRKKSFRLRLIGISVWWSK